VADAHENDDVRGAAHAMEIDEAPPPHRTAVRRAPRRVTQRKVGEVG